MYNWANNLKISHLNIDYIVHQWHTSLKPHQNPKEHEGKYQLYVILVYNRN